MIMAFVVRLAVAIVACLCGEAQGFVVVAPRPGAQHPVVLLKAGPQDEQEVPSTTGPRGAPRRTSRRMPSSTRPARVRRTRPSPPQYQVATERAPHQYDHTQADARPFVDALEQVRHQDPNIDAPVFDAPMATTIAGPLIEHDHMQTHALDELFPQVAGFSQLFFSNGDFRHKLRQALRQDLFDATPAYAGLSDKARNMLLLPDSSLQGSWKCQGRRSNDGSVVLRMPTLTKVLHKFLGPTAPTGDDFLDTIGALCGSQPQTHLIDIVGITDRQITHSWHQDTGRSPNQDTYTVLLGFPKEDNYTGGGVFSHLVKLSREQWAPEGHAPQEPVLYPHAIDEKYIIRPQFSRGQEIILYRDVDVLHSAPDVAYRSSVMRFM